jgi:hypothetical protein
LDFFSWSPQGVLSLQYLSRLLRFDNGDSYSRLASDIYKAIWLLFLSILVLVLLPMVVYYFNGYAHARSLGIMAQFKIMGEPSLVFSTLWFDCLSLYLEKIQDSIMEEERV